MRSLAWSRHIVRACARFRASLCPWVVCASMGPVPCDLWKTLLPTWPPLRVTVTARGHALAQPGGTNSDVRVGCPVYLGRRASWPVRGARTQLVVSAGLSPPFHWYCEFVVQLVVCLRARGYELTRSRPRSAHADLGPSCGNNEHAPPNCLVVLGAWM